MGPSTIDGYFYYWEVFLLLFAVQVVFKIMIKGRVWQELEADGAIDALVLNLCLTVVKP